MRIALIWQGFSGRYGKWEDGLWAAMQEIEKRGHEVEYFDTNQIEEIVAYWPDVVLYWEAPVTLKGQDADNYKAVMALPFKKCLLFAGGVVSADTCFGFDMFFVESLVDEQSFESLNLPWKRAFGVNTQIMKPEKQPKVFDGMHHATCASWKRLNLFSRALGARGVVAGRFQESDPQPFLDCRKNGTLLLPELNGATLASLLSSSYTHVNTSEMWGGGQRATLEALACGIPAIVMKDSVKCSEYVLESGCGMVVEPDEHHINEAIGMIKEWSKEKQASGVEYIQSKWTERHYADALLEGIASIL